MAVSREDPYGSFNFLVQIEGVEAAGFREAELPDVEIEPIAYREGADRVSSVRLLPGRVRHGRLVLRRGIAGDLTLWQWIRALTQGALDRRDVAVVLLDEARNPVLTWRLRRAWPAKLEGPRLDAQANEVAIETLELVHEGLELE